MALRSLSNQQTAVCMVLTPEGQICPEDEKTVRHLGAYALRSGSSLILSMGEEPFSIPHPFRNFFSETSSPLSVSSTDL